MAYDNNMRGIISKNERKEKDSHPDIKGSCEINGTEYWISGWIKVRNDGEGRFYSLSFEPKQKQPPKPAPTRQAPPNRTADRSMPHKQGSGFDDMDSDVPF